MLLSMDLTVLYLAVPSLSADLEPTSAELLWITDIYGFLIAGSLITMGALGDRIGRRRLLLIGAGAFAATSVLAAFSTTAPVLIATRALLGVAAATLMPSTLSLIRNMFPNDAQRTAAIGAWVTSFSIGGVVGPVIGGILLDHFWWGSVFLLALPVMALLLVLGPILLPEYRDPDAAHFDVPSAALSLIAVLAAIYGVKRIATDGPDLLAVVPIVLGVVIGIVFVRRQRRLADPLIDLALFRVPEFTTSMATNMTAIFVMLGSFLFIAQYLQLVRGMSSLEAGMWLLPQSVTFVFGSNIAPVLVRRLRKSTVVAGGLVVTSAGFVLLTQVGPSSGLGFLVAALVFTALGLAMAFTLTIDMVVSAAPAERAGSASAMSETGTELGGALGIAILGSIGTAIYRNSVTDSLSGRVPNRALDAATDTLGGAIVAADTLPGRVGDLMVDAGRVAFTQGLRLTAVIGGVVMMIAAVAVAAVLGRSPAGAPEGEPDAEDLVADSAGGR
jgi:DHA2 family multidrug resistance protein-like MFS transporter